MLRRMLGLGMRLTRAAEGPRWPAAGHRDIGSRGQTLDQRAAEERADIDGTV